MAVLTLLLVACPSSDPVPTGQSGDTGGDSSADASRDTNFDSDSSDTSADLDTSDDTTDPICPANGHLEAGVCVCDADYYELSDRCVDCLENSHCGGRVCSGNVCRLCFTHDECGEQYCGDDGLCSDVAPACVTNGDRRCRNHSVQYCADEIWVDDNTGECEFGCDDESGDCYPDTNVGWIGGRCGTEDDCDRIDENAAICLGNDEGFVDGTCSQQCVGICPDESGSTDSVTFCVDSEGINSDGICVSRCDESLFPDTGCRPGYECRVVDRYNNPAISEPVCLPINWWRNPPRRFEFGVSAGEVTATSAIVWTHGGFTDSVAVVSFGTSPENLSMTATGVLLAANGYTVQISLESLTPDSDYYYQFNLDGVAASPVGDFHTAPETDGGDPVRFVFTGDIHQDRDFTWDIFTLMGDEAADFFVNMGDWPYADSATTDSAYNLLHQATHGDIRIRDFFRHVPVYAMFDDHEVTNDWDGAYRLSNPAQVELGLRIWSNWWPLRQQFDGQFYRSWRYGDLEFFMLDTRSHRDPRIDFDDSDKTMLGPDQLDWLLDGLAASDAVFKIVFTSVPLDFTTTGSDAWAGYSTERDYIWQTIQDDAAITGVVFLTADQHWFSVHHHNSGFKEFQVGPISASLRDPPAVRDLHQVFIEEDYNYGIMEYDPAAGGSLTITGVNVDGDTLYTETVPAGRGRIQVTANVNAPFVICPLDLLGPDCGHVFDGVAPTSFEYATPGQYTIDWLPLGGFDAPNGTETLTLTDGGSIAFDGQYDRRPLPFVDTFDAEGGWVAVDEGTQSAPSDWHLAVLGAENVFVEASNIFDVFTDPGDEDSSNPSHLLKLGTLVYNGDTEWSDYDFTVSFYAEDDDGVGMIARYQDEYNYYRFHFDQQRLFARLEVRIDGDFTLLDEVSFTAGSPPFDLTTWTDMRMTVDGNSVECYLDDLDTPLISVADGALANGAVGLYSWGSENLAFDDVNVIEIE